MLMHDSTYVIKVVKTFVHPTHNPLDQSINILICITTFIEYINRVNIYFFNCRCSNTIEST